jgi:hypothetical protein
MTGTLDATLPWLMSFVGSSLMIRSLPLCFSITGPNSYRVGYGTNKPVQHVRPSNNIAQAAAEDMQGIWKYSSPSAVRTFLAFYYVSPPPFPVNAKNWTLTINWKGSFNFSVASSSLSSSVSMKNCFRALVSLSMVSGQLRV